MRLALFAALLALSSCDVTKPCQVDADCPPSIPPGWYKNGTFYAGIRYTCEAGRCESELDLAVKPECVYVTEVNTMPIGPPEYEEQVGNPIFHPLVDIPTNNMPMSGERVGASIEQVLDRTKALQMGLSNGVAFTPYVVGNGAGAEYTPTGDPITFAGAGFGGDVTEGLRLQNNTPARIVTRTRVNTPLEETIPMDGLIEHYHVFSDTTMLAMSLPQDEACEDGMEISVTIENLLEDASVVVRRDIISPTPPDIAFSVTGLVGGCRLASATFRRIADSWRVKHYDAPNCTVTLD